MSGTMNPSTGMWVAHLNHAHFSRMESMTIPRMTYPRGPRVNGTFISDEIPVLFGTPKKSSSPKDMRVDFSIITRSANRPNEDETRVHATPKI